MILLYLALLILLAITLLLWREERCLSKKIKTIRKKIFLQNLYAKVINIIPYTICQTKEGSDENPTRNIFGQLTHTNEKSHKKSSENCHFVFDDRNQNYINPENIGESDHLFSEEEFMIDNPMKGLKKKSYIDGRTEYFDSYKYVIHYHEEVVTITVDIPITELILAKKKTKEHSRLESTFLSNMSHENHAPLDKIWSSCQSLIDAKKGDELKQYIEELAINTNIFLKRISDVISLSEVETSTSEHFQTAKIEVVELLMELQVNLNLQLQALKKENRIELVYFNVYQNLMFYQDKNHFMQIMNNFLSNAVKYTSSGTIKYGIVAGQNYYLFFVKDTGIGILKDNVDKVFTRSENDENISGRRGFGLSISKKIVTGKKGQMGVISKKEKGSLFWAFFPYSTTYELNPNSDFDSNELHDITESIIRCDELKDLELDNPF